MKIFYAIYIYLFLAACGYHEKALDDGKRNQFVVDDINMCTSKSSYCEEKPYADKAYGFSVTYPVA